MVNIKVHFLPTILLALFTFRIRTIFSLIQTEASEPWLQYPSRYHGTLQSGGADKEVVEEGPIIYNKIPNSMAGGGGTSFMSFLYNLHAKEHINLTHVDISSKIHRLTYSDQYEFALNILYMKKGLGLLVCHGHFPFVDFTRFNFAQPLYINLIRDPLERLVSHYYSLYFYQNNNDDDADGPRERDDTNSLKPIQQQQQRRKTFDECVAQRGEECHPKRLWLQIPYFCGPGVECWVHGSQKALEKAKENVINNYFLVGTMREVEKFVELLDLLLPSFFQFSRDMFSKDGGVTVEQPVVWVPLNQSTLGYFQNNKIWQAENEFYEFVKHLFDCIYKRQKVTKR